MKNSLNLKPENVFYYFEELSKIPHGSGNTKAISDYCVAFAKERNLEYYQDELNNVIIIKNPTEGYENAEPIIIQGHLDMVCEKEEDCNIDFTKDGLDLYVDGEFLRARGTTLGGDDGIAIAYSLALLDEPGLQHPRLEFIFTVDEETGMDGVQGIDLSPIKGHIMLNIDSDEEGVFLTSCAGGLGVTIELPVERVTESGEVYELKVGGLFGGHSGGEIHKERGNSNILMGRVLEQISYNCDFALVNLEGGTKDNAITRQTVAKLIVPAEAKTVFEESVKAIEAVLKKEYKAADPDLFVNATLLGEGKDEVLHPTAFTKLLFLLRQVPYGVQHMSVEIPGLVETSCNVGIIKLDTDVFHLNVSIRSSVSTRKYEVCDRISFLGEFIGAEVLVGGDYPAWEYKAESQVRDKIAGVYKELFNEEPQIMAIHAGLECGYFADKIHGLDAVSFGPKNLDIHTPQERLSIASAEKYWKLLVEYLKRAK